MGLFPFCISTRCGVQDRTVRPLAPSAMSAPTKDTAPPLPVGQMAAPKPKRPYPFWLGGTTFRPFLLIAPSVDILVTRMALTIFIR